MERVKQISYLIVGLAVLGAALSVFVPTPEGRDPLAFHISFMFYVLMSIPYLGAGLLFLWALKGFTTRFKFAYGTMAAGLAMLGLAFLQIPVFTLLDLMKSPWVVYGGVAIPFTLSILIIYLGVRAFARLFGIRSIAASATLVIISVVAAAGLSTLLPHAPATQLQEIAIDASVAVYMVNLVFVAWSAVLTYFVRKQAGGLYVPAMAWLMGYFIIVVLPSFPLIILALTVPEGHFIIDSGILNSIYFLAALPLLKSAMEFHRIRFAQEEVLRAGGHIFVDKGVEPATAKQSAIDVLLYVIELVSNPQAVDIYLDDFRVLMAVHPKNTPLSDQEQLRLVRIYTDLEHYLAELEPVHKFSKQELRRTIEDRFSKAIEEDKIFKKAITGT